MIKKQSLKTIKYLLIIWLSFHVFYQKYESLVRILVEPCENIIQKNRIILQYQIIYKYRF